MFRGGYFMEQNGSKLLKVSSILMIIGGIFGAIGSVLMAALAGVMTAVSGNADVQQAASESNVEMGSVNAILWIAVVVLVASAVIEIIAGIKGKKNWNNPAMAKTLMVWGIVCAVISVIGNILFATSGGSAAFSIICGLVIPVLYIIGTVQLKNQAN